MSGESSKAISRAVESLANIYAVVIGLALAQAIETLVVKSPSSGIGVDIGKTCEGLPPFVALVATLVPFWHGMNRHLDRCYVTKTGSPIQKAILLDVFAFFFEAILLFAAAWCLRDSLGTFYCLGLLLVVDMMWGLGSHFIHFRGEASHVIKWAGINIGAGFFASFAFALPFQGKVWLLMLIAIVRTIADYWLCTDFYFPGSEHKKSVA